MSEEAPCGIPISLCKRLEGIDFQALNTWATAQRDKAMLALCKWPIEEWKANVLRGQITAMNQILDLQGLVKKSLKEVK